MQCTVDENEIEVDGWTWTDGRTDVDDDDDEADDEDDDNTITNEYHMKVNKCNCV